MPPESAPASAPQFQTYEELANHIHTLATRPNISLSDVPNPDAARALATGRSHDSLTVLASQVRQLKARQAARGNIANQLEALHDALISQTYTNVPYASETANFASQGVQGLTRFGGRLVSQDTLGWKARALDWGVLAGGVAVFGMTMKKLWGAGKNQPGIIRWPLQFLKAVGISVATLGTGWLAMRYVDNRAAADETAIDNPDRRRGVAAQLNTQNAPTGEIRTNDPRVNFRNVELSALTLPIRLPDNRILRFAASGSAVIIRRQSIAPGTNALTESIQMQVDAIHTNSDGEFVIKQGSKTIYVPRDQFFTAMASASLGAPTVLGGFNNPRAITGRTADSITVNWQTTPA